MIAARSPTLSAASRTSSLPLTGPSDESLGYYPSSANADLGTLTFSNAILTTMTRNILAAVDDMFFAAKIRATAEALGVSIKFYRQLEGLVGAAAEQSPGLIIVDLHNEKLDPIELARKLKASDSVKHVPVLGFFSHVQTD